MAYVSRFLYQHLGTFLLCVFSYLLPLIYLFTTFLFRLRRGDGSLETRLDFSEVLPQETCDGSETEHKPEEFNDAVELLDHTNEGEEEASQFSFKFRFPAYEEFIKCKGKIGLGEFVGSELLPSSYRKKYEFMLETNLNGFIEKPEVVDANVKDVDFDTQTEDVVALDKILKHTRFEVFHKEKRPDHAAGAWSEEGTEESNGIRITESKKELDKAENKSQSDFDFSNDVLFQSEKDSLFTDSDSASIGFEHMHSLISGLVDSYSDGFLSDEDFGGGFEIDALNDLDGDKVGFHHPAMPEENQDSEHFDCNDIDVLGEELRELERDHLNKMESMASEFLSENDFHEARGIPEFRELDDEMMEGSGEYEKLESKNAAVLDSGDANKLEPMWEHQDLIEQLKAELRKVRTTGLPTILEESESPEMEDLKPWKVDESFQREDCMNELRKFYNTYRERMRKFDILTYQKMYAIGFLQKEPLKDPLQLLSSQKSSGLTLKSLLSQNIWLFKQKSHETDPMERFFRELRSDLEVVCVGQMCLSWEFLYWQYGKALELWDSDPRMIHRYNEVSEEFQQFTVLLLRFTEDELFQGTRVQHYIKCRYDFHKLLQVPLIREDSWKDNEEARNFERGNSITSDMLVEILEECIRIFWRFVKADKESSGIMGKGHKRVHPEVQSAEDIGLLRKVTKSLHKKERKLKDILRSENSILRSFRRCREDDIDHALYFFSQVDMTLVSRVLNMSALTRDQLVWCQNKLSRISFLHTKIHVEPSFLLFPCSY